MLPSGDGRKLMVYQDRIWAIGGFNSINSTSVSSVDSFDPEDELVASKKHPSQPQEIGQWHGLEMEEFMFILGTMELL